MDVARN